MTPTQTMFSGGPSGPAVRNCPTSCSPKPVEQEGEPQGRLDSVVHVLPHRLQPAVAAPEVPGDQRPRVLEQRRVGDQERANDAQHQAQGGPVGGPEEVVVGADQGQEAAWRKGRTPSEGGASERRQKGPPDGTRRGAPTRLTGPEPLEVSARPGTSFRQGVLPHEPMKIHEPNAELAARHDWTDGLATFSVRPLGWEFPTFLPGQFTNLALPGGARTGTPRPAPTSGARTPSPPSPGAETVDFFIRRVDERSPDARSSSTSPSAASSSSSPAAPDTSPSTAPPTART